ncbi:hypothetical protein [Paenibacillus sinopodophylli]|uniref:hypothetical protein n=1 Tax=Paenibacillus sinopodophylli TaxID=1837342 RepID=UPI001FEA67EF|nr:hypothetical protein [Paenibacillus sinopodophylli]
MEEIRIEHFKLDMCITTPKDMASLAGASFGIAERVPETSGEAFDWQSWYTNWVEEQNGSEAMPEPSHLIVEAADTFEAVIPWEELGDAAVLYAQEGQPLTKSGPIRLYVPNGSSRCLNVKSIVKLRFVRHAEGAIPEDASYGFKNTITVDQLRMTK